MKLRLLVFASLLLVQTLTSQNYQTVEEVNDACAQLGFSGDEDAEIAVDDILSQIGLFRNFTIQECPEINNAVAKNIDIGDGKKARYILYDKDFFNRIEDKAANDWAATSILAHEIGHHLNGHALNDEGSGHKWELEADEFSGFVLARMGSSLEDAQSAISTFKLEKATRTHPAKIDRLRAIQKGWNRGNGKSIKIKEISKEEKKKLIENNKEVISNITAEQVISNYIDAIGGEEKIKKIKSLSKSYFIPSKNGDGSSRSINYKIIFLTPSEILYMGNNIFSELEPKHLVLPNKMYVRDNTNSKWNPIKTESNATDNETSFIQEFTYLINNEELILDGVEMIDDELCYKIMVPKKHTDINYFKRKKERLRAIVTRTYTKFFSVETGLLKVDNINTVINKAVLNKRGKVQSETRQVSNHKRKYSNYRLVEGVMFPFEVDTHPNIEIYSEIKINPAIDLNDFDPSK